MTWKALPYILLLGFFYGSTLIASRFTVGLMNANLYVGVRLAIAATLFLLLYLISSKRRFPTSRDLIYPAILLGVFGTAIPMTTIVNGVRFVSSGIASIIFTTGPAFTALFAFFLLPEERLSVRKWFGIALALGGTTLLFSMGETGLGSGSAGADSFKGYSLLTTATIMSTLTMVLARKYMKDLDPVDVSTIRLITAAIIVLPLSIFIFGWDVSAVPPIGVGAIIWATLFGTFGAFLLNFYNLTQFGATATSLVSFFVPIFGTLGGALILGERITAGMIIGMVIILGGIALLRESAPQAEAVATPAD